MFRILEDFQIFGRFLRCLLFVSAFTHFFPLRAWSSIVTLYHFWTKYFRKTLVLSPQMGHTSLLNPFCSVPGKMGPVSEYKLIYQKYWVSEISAIHRAKLLWHKICVQRAWQNIVVLSTSVSLSSLLLCLCHCLLLPFFLTDSNPNQLCASYWGAVCMTEFPVVWGPTLFWTMLIVCIPITNLISTTVLGYSERPECAHWAWLHFRCLGRPPSIEKLSQTNFSTFRLIQRQYLDFQRKDKNALMSTRICASKTCLKDCRDCWACRDCSYCS